MVVSLVACPVETARAVLSLLLSEETTERNPKLHNLLSLWSSSSGFLTHEVNNRKFFECHVSLLSQSEFRIILYVIIEFICRGAAK